jgi:hypothetical protein
LAEQIIDELTAALDDCFADEETDFALVLHTCRDLRQPAAL